MHPGWHVGFDLVLYAAYVFFAVTVGISAINNYAERGDPSDTEDYGYYDQATPEQASAITTLVRVDLTGWVMLVLLVYVLQNHLTPWHC